METHDRQKHPKPQSSLIEEPDFIELCRIAKRLSAAQQGQLSDILLMEQWDRVGAELDEALRIFENDDKPFDIA